MDATCVDAENLVEFVKKCSRADMQIFLRWCIDNSIELYCKNGFYDRIEKFDAVAAIDFIKGFPDQNEHRALSFFVSKDDMAIIDLRFL